MGGGCWNLVCQADVGRGGGLETFDPGAEPAEISV
jgi:hypothetical protein